MKSLLLEFLSKIRKCNTKTINTQSAMGVNNSPSNKLLYMRFIHVDEHASYTEFNAMQIVR